MEIKIDDDKLLVDGVLQSVIPPPYNWGYWRYMVPDFEPKNVLMLGVGAGTIARMIKAKYPKSNIIGIDDNLDLLIKAKELNLLEIDMDVIRREALEFVNSAVSDNYKWDLIIVDLWDGGWYPTHIFKPEFIAKLKRLLTKEGKIYINAPDIEKCASVNNLKLKVKTDTGGIIYETD